MSPREALVPEETVRTARKEHPCTSLGRTCGRHIAKGDPYTQISYPPGCKPFELVPGWTILRACTACRPLAPAELPAGVTLPCTFGDGTQQCVLPAGHGPDHEFLIGLF